MATNLHGIIVNCSSTVSAEICDNPDVYCLHIIRNWNDLNPLYDEYVWTELLSSISIAVSFGKKFSLSIVAGEKSPEWIYSAPYSVPSLTFDEYSTKLPIGDVTSHVVPLFTDTTYKELWKKFLLDLSTMLQTEYIVSEWDIWNSLTAITITGINTDSNICMINNQTDITNGTTASSNAIELWQTTGLTSNIAVNTFVDIYYYFEEYFPNITKLLYLENEGFPKLDNSDIDFLLIDTINNNNLSIIPVYNKVSMFDNGKELFSRIRDLNILSGAKLNKDMFENCNISTLTSVFNSISNTKLMYNLVEIYPSNVINTPIVLSNFANTFGN